MENLDFEINFTDITLNEADGDMAKVKEIMSKEIPRMDKWTLRSQLTITSQLGMCTMTIQCNEKGEIHILEYTPSSVGDLFYNPDILVLSQWAQQYGWNVPEPSENLIKSNKAFWKHFWDTLIIDSRYFDEAYGKRPQLEQEG